MHVLILMWFALPDAQKTLAADILGAPTNVSIHFTTPLKKEPKPIVEKPIPETLNKIEPAAISTTQPVQKNPAQTSKPDLTPVVSEAKLKGRRIQPEYPKRSLRMHQEAVVWLRVLISETGARKELKLHKPSQYALLNQAAVKAVKKWTFEPNIVNGKAVQSWVEIPIEFKIQ